MLAARCLVLNSYLIDKTFLRTFYDHNRRVKLSTMLFTEGTAFGKVFDLNFKLVSTKFDGH